MFFKNQTPSKRDKQNFESLMKTHMKNLFLLPALIAGLGLIMVGRATAQIVTNLTIIRSAANVILTWPTNATGFTLQSTTNLGSPAVWTTVVPGPVVVNGNNTVPSPISGSQKFYRLSQSAIRSGMALIPAGSFTMGDSLDGESDATPTVSVTVSAFYMDVNLVSYSQWQTVYNWATSHGYSFDNPGLGEAANHPVQSVNWYDVVKWNNARSQQAGLTPVYYTDAGLTQVYISGDTDAVYPNWAANGYRLPTEAECQKAARGGLNGLRFPWGNTIDWNHANYNSQWTGGAPTYSYDLAYTSGYDPAFTNGETAYTSPVGYFAPNGYGLYDMAGNVQVWCWDWYAAPPYPTGSPYLGGTDPHGPASSPDGYRLLHGGFFTYGLRCAKRSTDSPRLEERRVGKEGRFRWSLYH